MFILQLVNKDFEGTWIENIFISKNKNMLISKIQEEKEKYIQKQVILFEDTSYKERLENLFAIGDFEIFINEKLAFARDGYLKDKLYILDDKKFDKFKDFKDYLLMTSKPLATSLGIDEELIELIINNRNHASLKFIVTEIEEI